ncbi:DUF2306 domain-containing protein [Streptomyces sp. NPDC005571]|uniref:DUF2306 domain-containing protein n=1 Tax=Streptomyces sp. NPDC005571 TaxID=3156888 RepID=UPI0033A67D2C
MRAETRPLEIDNQVQDGHKGGAARFGRSKRTGGIVVGALALGVIGIIIFMWTSFTYDPAKARVPSEQTLVFYPVLVIHVVGCTVAIATVVLQVWPWLRRNHPNWHRFSGRLYILAGVYPATVTALILTGLYPTTPIVTVRDVLGSLLWLSMTAFGFVLARQGRHADHRRWMLRSFALTLSVVVSLTVHVPVEMWLRSMQESRFHGSEDVVQQMLSGIDLWLSLTLPLLAVEWWLEREQLQRSARRRTRKQASKAGTPDSELVAVAGPTD